MVWFDWPVERHHRSHRHFLIGFILSAFAIIKFHSLSGCPVIADRKMGWHSHHCMCSASSTLDTDYSLLEEQFNYQSMCECIYCLYSSAAMDNEGGLLWVSGTINRSRQDADKIVQQIALVEFVTTWALTLIGYILKGNKQMKCDKERNDHEHKKKVKMISKWLLLLFSSSVFVNKGSDSRRIRQTGQDRTASFFEGLGSRTASVVFIYLTCLDSRAQGDGLSKL